MSTLEAYRNQACLNLCATFAEEVVVVVEVGEALKLLLLLLFFLLARAEASYVQL